MAEDAKKTPTDLIPENGFVIEFPGVSDARAGVYAGELRTDIETALEDENAAATIDQVRTNPESQDPGTILAIILGANSTIAIAYGIARWLNRPNQTHVIVRTRKIEVVIRNANSKDVEKQLKAIGIPEVT